MRFNFCLSLFFKFFSFYSLFPIQYFRSILLSNLSLARISTRKRKEKKEREKENKWLLTPLMTANWNLLRNSEEIQAKFRRNSVMDPRHNNNVITSWLGVVNVWLLSGYHYYIYLVIAYNLKKCFPSRNNVSLAPKKNEQTPKIESTR